MIPNSFDELLDFAIREEELAVEYYTNLAAKVNEQHVRNTLLDMAEQERGHKRKLESVKAKGVAQSGLSHVSDLQIADYLVKVDPTPDLTFQGALIIAMKREKAAFRMYSDLASRSQNEEVRSLFHFLAQEEAAHKLSFELQYDDLIFQEN
jgi:rubrerythrin